MNLIEIITKFGFATMPVWGLSDEGLCCCGDPHENDSSAGKHPKTANGHLSAVYDPELAKQWLDEGSNIGINCKESGVVVLDIDPRHDGYNSLEKLLAPLPGILPKTLTVLTGSSSRFGNTERGMHLYFRCPVDANFHASFGKDYPGIDIKHNGYVIAPGSKHASGHTYELAQSDGFEELSIADLPQFLLSIISRDQARGTNTVGIRDLGGFSSAMSDYGQKALIGESETVKNAREGDRNQTLFKSGLRIGSLISGGHVPAEEALEVLVTAALESGLDYDESVTTLLRPSGQGALQLGAANPRGPEPLPDELVEWAQRQTEGSTAAKEEEQRSLPGFLNVVDWEQAFSAEVGEDWLLPGFLATGRSHLLYSQPGLGKSLLALEISARLAAGQEVLGRGSGASLKVLYLDHENSIIGDIVPRLREMGFDHGDLSHLVYSSFPDMDTLDTETGGRQLLEILDSVKPEFVILDTVSRAIVGEENNNTTWLRFYKFAGQHLKSRGITFVRLDHVGKDTNQGPRGGSAKTGDVDLVWKLGGTPGGTKFRLTCEKSRLVVPAGTILLERSTHPLLQHTMQVSSSDFNWADLVQEYELTKEVCGLIWQDVADVGQMDGQKLVWNRVKGKVSRLGATKDQFVTAHRLVREEHAEAGASSSSQLVS